MKTILTILILFPLTIFGQTKHEGKFCTEPNLLGWCLDFKSDSFYFHSWTCLSETNGKGIYKSTRKKLDLYFISSDTFKTTFEINKKNCKPKDSITLTIKVTDSKDYEPLPFTWITLVNLKDTITTSTNIEGIAILKIKRSNDVYRLEADFVEHNHCHFKIKPDNCKDIIINLAPNFGIIENGTIWSFKIKKNDSKVLVLKGNKDKYNTILYKKQK